jgi:Zn-dependent protease with chaperone function
MNFDFDFQRYVERRKGARDQQTREGAAYAYAGDLKVLRTLDRLKPVKMAVEAAAGLWRSSARAELLGPAIKASEGHFPKVHAAAHQCAERLHISPPTLYVTAGALAGGVSAWTFGSEDDPAILLHASLAERGSELALLDAVGRECGHLQNGHVVYRTALYFLSHSAGTFVRWIISPATLALGMWARRGDVTGDRAGLLCSRDLEASTVGLIKSALGPDVMDGAAASDELLAHHKPLQQRAAALAAFAKSSYYTGLSGPPTGPTAEECDAEVARIIK